MKHISRLLNRAYPDYDEMFPKKEPVIPKAQSKLSAMLHALFLVIIMGILFEVEKVHVRKSVSKTKVANYYGVDRKTLNKWVLYFGKEVFPNYNDYLSQKKLTLLNFTKLKYTFGNPKEFPVMSKKQIIEEREGTYSSLRGCIRAYPKLYGLSFEAFLNLKKFPPKVAERIIKAYD